MIKNKIKDLSEEQLAIVLKTEPGCEERYPSGKTLGDFIKDHLPFSEDSSLTDLYDEMSCFHLVWPFRTLHVTVEVTLSRGYTLAVLDDNTINDFEKGNITIDEVDPDFNLETAQSLLRYDPDDGYVSGDYAVCDDMGRTLVDWDD